MSQENSLDLLQVFGVTKADSFTERRTNIISEIKSSATSPQHARTGLSKFEVPSVSFIPTLASEADLSGMDLGKGMYLPTDLRTRASVYELQPNESVVIGVFVTDQGMFAKRVTYLGGDNVASGALMRLELVDADGRVRRSAEGNLEIIDPSIGHGRIVVKDPELIQKSVWVLWSCIDVEK
jgi:hypothetical protein